jgi:hypothetical protein
MFEGCDHVVDCSVTSVTGQPRIFHAE